MTAHVIYTAWDAKNPATFSRTILQDILRQRLGFQGVIMSDDLEMKAVENYFPFDAFPRMGIEAGLDMFMICNNVEKVRILHDQLIQDVDNRAIPIAPIQQSVERILHLKKNLISPPINPPNPAYWQETHTSLASELQSHLPD
jgi:beta-N-acetylhexosaminidase